MKDRTRIARTRKAVRAVAALLAGATLALARAADAPSGPENFFQYDRMTQASISPDGQTVALTTATSKTGRVRLVALDLKTMKFTSLAGFEDADIASFHWVNEHRLVFDLDDRQAPVGKLDAASGLYGVNIDGTAMRQLVSQYGKPFFERGDDKSRVLPWSTDFLQAIGDRTSEDVYVVRPLEYDRKHVDYEQLQRLNTLGGFVTDIDTPPHAFDWVFDAKGDLRVLVTDKDNHSKVLTRDPGSKDWVELGNFEHFADDKSFHPSYIDQDGTLFVEANNGGDRTSVWTYDLAHRKMSDTPFLVSQRYDLEPAYLPMQGKLAGLRYDVDAEVTQWLTPEMEALQGKVDKMLPSTVNRLSVASRGDGHFVVIHAYSDRVPGLFFLYDLQKGKLITLGNAQPDIDPKQMASMEQVHYPARDGLDIPAYLSIPHGAERKNLPLVVLVHGGPYVRGRVWGWDPEVQFLASHGYAVLEPAFRGSTGYGEKLFTAGWRQWGLAMQDDVADGVKWAVAQGIVDSKRVCIAGASYGGYAVLMGLARDPDLYRCGVDWVGVTDLGLLYSADWSDMSDSWKKYGMPRLIGDPVADAAQLKATSPTENVAKIRAPVLLAYGGKDVRVPIEHGERFHDALMKQPGARSEWVVYDDEGHGWRSLETNIDFWNRVTKFLDANIGAR
jgi:dienelactone hydrolase